MNNSKIENVQPEQVNNSEQKADNKQVSPSIANARVVGSAKDELGLFDSANGKSIKAYKIVDATELTNNSKRCVIKYALSVRGVIAQICDWYKPDVDLGGSVHYFIDETSPKELSEDEVFERRCRVMDAHALTLSHFIYDNR
jgi:hypothetical protein